jgi:hypothetical protein
MASDLEKRIAQLERRLNMKRSGLRVLVVKGGLPPGEPLFAVSGEHEWLREPTEVLEDFCERVAAAARDAGERSLLIGGLPSTPSQDERARSAYEAWLLDGYSDVPPMEQPGFTRPRSRLGWG